MCLRMQSRESTECNNTYGRPNIHLHRSQIAIPSIAQTGDSPRSVLINGRNNELDDRELYAGLIRLHVLHHAAEEPLYGLAMIEELGRHGYKLSAGTLYPILHGLEKNFPGKTFHPVNPNAVCGFMKTITLDNVIRSLETLSPEVRVPEDIARRARQAIERMLELA